MTIKINGTNTTAQPSITGTDTDTGLVYGTDEVSIVTGGTEKVKVASNGAVSIASPVEAMHKIHRTGTIANADYLGAVSWQANDSASNVTEYVKVFAQAKTSTNGSEASELAIETYYSGTRYRTLNCREGVVDMPRQPFCTGGQNGGWLSFQSSPTTDYGVLDANGYFFTNSGDGFYAGSALNGYKVIHARFSGTYLFLHTLYASGTFDARVAVQRNSSHQLGFIETGTQSNSLTYSATYIETLAANDSISFQFSGTSGGQLYTGDNHSTLSIVKIG
jgi:hypothetical protein